jgi:hypothetical protein
MPHSKEHSPLGTYGHQFPRGVIAHGPTGTSEFREKNLPFSGGGVIVTIASIRAVAARTGVPGWPRGAVCPQGVPCYGLVMDPRQPACNRRVAPGPTRTHFWLFYAILEVGARTSPLLYHGPTPRPPAGRPRSHGGAGGINAGAGYPAAPFGPSHGLRNIGGGRRTASVISPCRPPRGPHCTPKGRPEGP